MLTLELLAGHLQFFSSSPTLLLWYLNLPLFTSTNIKYLFNTWGLTALSRVIIKIIRKLKRVNTLPLQNKDQTSNRLFLAIFIVHTLLAFILVSGHGYPTFLSNWNSCENRYFTSTRTTYKNRLIKINCLPLFKVLGMACMYLSPNR